MSIKRRLRRPRETARLLLPVQLDKCQIGKLNQFLCSESDLHVAYWNVRTLQNVGVQELTIRELRKDNVDINRLLEGRIPDSGDPGEEVCYHLYLSEVEDSTRMYGVAIALSEAVQASFSVGDNLTPPC